MTSLPSRQSRDDLTAAAWSDIEKHKALQELEQMVKRYKRLLPPARDSARGDGARQWFWIGWGIAGKWGNDGEENEKGNIDPFKSKVMSKGVYEYF